MTGAAACVVVVVSWTGLRTVVLEGAATVEVVVVVVVSALDPPLGRIVTSES